MSTSSRDKYHHGDLRSALITTATELLEEEGTFSLRAVARRAGVSPTAPYRHFTDLEALESALAVQGFRQLRELLSPPDRTTTVAAEGLIGFAVTYINFALERPALFKLMFGRECDPTNDERVAAAGELHSLLTDSLRGPFPDADHEALATALWALTHGLAFLHLDGKLPVDSPDDVTTRVTRSFNALLSGRPQN